MHDHVIFVWDSGTTKLALAVAVLLVAGSVIALITAIEYLGALWRRFLHWWRS